MQRDIKAIIAAHKMDPKRRELYVEGCRDRSFFLWFIKDNRDPNAIVFEISSVKCEPQVEGGCRGRLLRFANEVESQSLAIKCFADSDFDRVLGRSAPANTWLTDCRDLEWYFLQQPCIEKVMHLAFPTTKHTAGAILSEVARLGRPLAALRILSERDALKLPFQDRPARAYIKRSRSGSRNLECDYSGYIQALLQGANISLTRMSEIKSEIALITAETKDIPDSELVHGKDIVAILQAILSGSGIKEDAVEPAFWASLELSFVCNFPNLKAALRFLTRQGSTQSGR